MCKLQSLLRSNNIRVLQSHEDDDNDIGSTDISVGGDPSSACLWAMVTDFLEVDTPVDCTHIEDHITSRAGATFLSSCGANSSDAILKRAIQEMESFGESSAQDVVGAKIASCVAKALKSKSSMLGVESAHNEQALPSVLKHLRREGYDAGLCVIARKPGKAIGFPATGGHRYIDVNMEESKPVSGTPVWKRPSEKLIVDVGFCAHFEIVRPLPAYQKLLAMLPSTFVGKAALLQRVVRIMSQAARASLESQDMPIPPWRSFPFLLAKWLSPPCSRITSFDEAQHIVLNTPSSTNHIKPRVLAELDYNSDSANLADPPVNDGCEYGPKSFFLQGSAAKAWYPPPPTKPIPINTTDSHDNLSSSYTKKRRQRTVVSALALALTETRRTHMLTECVAVSEGRVHNRPQQSAGVVSAL